MSDVTCPYCNAENDVCHDDGNGTEEGVAYEEQCVECEKYFVFYTTIIWHYDAQKADCLNGAKHNLEKMNIYPNFWPHAVRCKDCGYENKGDIDKEAQEKYFRR